MGSAGGSVARSFDPFQQNSSARFVGHLYFPAPQPPSVTSCLSKTTTSNLAATSLTASIANAAALVEPRRLGTALVNLCAHQKLRDAGTVKDLERRPTQQRADRLNLGRATSSLTSACRLPARTSLCRKASGIVRRHPRTLVRVLSLDSKNGSRIAIAWQRPR